jgi:hypothetical protein
METNKAIIDNINKHRNNIRYRRKQDLIAALRGNTKERYTYCYAKAMHKFVCEFSVYGTGSYDLDRKAKQIIHWCIRLEKIAIRIRQNGAIFRLRMPG